MKSVSNIKIFKCFFAVLLILCGCTDNTTVSNGKDNCKDNDDNELSRYEILAETDSIEIISRIIQTFDDGFTIPLVQLSLRNKNTGLKSTILKTVKPNDYSWYISNGLDFVPVPIDSLIAAHRVLIWEENPLKLIVQGCPDMRNEFSYLVDVTNRKAWYVPTNSGYLGGTEEGFMIFRSYRYNSDPDMGGRHTFLQIYNENGRLVDSLDLEHCIFIK